MNPISNYRHKYRLHLAYSQHPRLYLATELAKTVGLAGAVIACIWIGFKSLTQQSAYPTDRQLAQVAQAPSTPVTGSSNQIRPGDIEIQAVASAAESITGSDSVIPATLSGEPTSIHDSSWILGLPATKFVIQLGASPDKSLLQQEAAAFPTGTAAIYPFKKTPSQRLVYGYSSGVYNSLEEAQRSIETLPAAMVAHGPWIRPIGALQKQIKALAADGEVQPI